MRICLYEDRKVADLAPFSLTRPAFDLPCGLTALADKHRQYFDPDVTGFLVRPHLADRTREANPLAPVNDPLWLRGGPTVLVNGRWVPPARKPGAFAPTSADLFAGGPCLAVCDGEIAFAAVTPDLLVRLSPFALDEGLDDWLEALPRRPVGGWILRKPWDLIERNGSQIAADFPQVVDADSVGFRPHGVALTGPSERLFVDPTASIDPLVMADTTNGPVVIGAGAVVTAFTRLEGPCSIGSGTHLLRANIRGGTTIGPSCRIGGEVEASVVLGFTNKAHDGFLGHSVVGEWVNLGAGTQTADLRTDYAPITVATAAGPVPTGKIKVGALLGDHFKTGIGTLLNCGTVAGPFSTLLPTGTLLPREVPAFARGGPGGLAEQADFAKLFAAADAMMRRRNQAMTPVLEAVYRAVASQTAAHRRRVLAGDAAPRHRRAG